MLTDFWLIFAENNLTVDDGCSSNWGHRTLPSPPRASARRQFQQPQRPTTLLPVHHTTGQPGHRYKRRDWRSYVNKDFTVTSSISRSVPMFDDFDDVIDLTKPAQSESSMDVGQSSSGSSGPKSDTSVDPASSATSGSFISSTETEFRPLVDKCNNITSLDSKDKAKVKGQGLKVSYPVDVICTVKNDKVPNYKTESASVIKSPVIQRKNDQYFFKAERSTNVQKSPNLLRKNDRLSVKTETIPIEKSPNMQRKSDKSLDLKSGQSLSTSGSSHGGITFQKSPKVQRKTELSLNPKLNLCSESIESSQVPIQRSPRIQRKSVEIPLKLIQCSEKVETSQVPVQKSPRVQRKSGEFFVSSELNSRCSEKVEEATNVPFSKSPRIHRKPENPSLKTVQNSDKPEEDLPFRKSPNVQRRSESNFVKKAEASSDSKALVSHKKIELSSFKLDPDLAKSESPPVPSRSPNTQRKIVDQCFAKSDHNSVHKVPNAQKQFVQSSERASSMSPPLGKKPACEVRTAEKCSIKKEPPIQGILNIPPPPLEKHEARLKSAQKRTSSPKRKVLKKRHGYTISDPTSPLRGFSRGLGMDSIQENHDYGEERSSSKERSLKERSSKKTTQDDMALPNKQNPYRPCRSREWEPSATVYANRYIDNGDYKHLDKCRECGEMLSGERCKSKMRHPVIAAAPQLSSASISTITPVCNINTSSICEPCDCPECRSAQYDLSTCPLLDLRSGPTPGRQVSRRPKMPVIVEDAPQSCETSDNEADIESFTTLTSSSSKTSDYKTLSSSGSSAAGSEGQCSPGESAAKKKSAEFAEKPSDKIVIKPVSLLDSMHKRYYPANYPAKDRSKSEEILPKKDEVEHTLVHAATMPHSRSQPFSKGKGHGHVKKKKVPTATLR